MMRILLATNYQPPHMGGIEFAGQSLKTCWERDGHAVTWLTTDIPRCGRPSAPDNIRFPATNILEDHLQVNAPQVAPFVYPQIVRLVKEHDVVNVHALTPALSTVVLCAAMVLRKPTVVTQHVAIIPFRSSFLSFIQKQFICSMARLSVKRGALITFVSPAARDFFVQTAGVPVERTILTPTGTDHSIYYFVGNEERERLRSKWAVPNRFSILFVGRLIEKKGLSLIRQVAERCREVRFTLVGGGQIDPTTWGLPNVRVLPAVSNEELRELYGAHDLFLMPSYGEGWPAVVPQAMACGLACLISEEVFEGHQKDADRFIVCRRDLETIVAKITQAAEGRLPLLAERKALSDYSLHAWDWQRTARIYLDLFEKVKR